MHFGNSAGNFGGSAVLRPVEHDSAAAMSKLVALLPNYMQIVQNWSEKRCILCFGECNQLSKCALQCSGKMSEFSQLHPGRNEEENNYLMSCKHREPQDVPAREAIPGGPKKTFRTLRLYCC